MSDNAPRQGGSDRWLTAIPAAIIIGAFLYLAYGPGMDSAYGGIGAILAIPFAFGMLITRSADYFSWFGCLGAPVALLAGSAVLIWSGLEGIVCVAMVMPPWIAAGLGGAAMSLYQKRKAETLHRERGTSDDRGNATLHGFAIAAVPFALIFAEQASPPQWETRQVSRSIVVDADRGRLWPLLVAIPDIGEREGRRTPTHDWLGIPRPSEARVIARGDDLVRAAKWGRDVRFEEIVTEIVPERRLAWRFAFPDDSISTHTDQHIQPDGPILRIQEGRYEVIELPDGRSKLTLTTSYAMRTRFGWYFGWWGERILGDISDNVLVIVSRRAERKQPLNPYASGPRANSPSPSPR